MTDAQLTQIVVEEWSVDNPDARLTQIAIEQWDINKPSVFMTQIAIEQWATLSGAGFFSARHV